MSQLTVDSFHNGVLFIPDQHNIRKLPGSQRVQNAEKTIPSFIPSVHQRLLRRNLVPEFSIPVSPFFSPIGTKKIGKPGQHIAREMFNDDYYTIRFGLYCQLRRSSGICAIAFSPRVLYWLNCFLTLSR